MKEKNFTRFMDTMIENLKTGNALGTAHIYQASKNAFITFLGKEEIYFRQIKPELLKCFEYFLRSRGNSWNTVSTYMRVLRAVYNRAVDRKLAPYMPRLFKKVYTGTRTDIKRALKPEDMGRLLNTQSTRKQTETLRRTHQLFVLMFLLRGLPFVDLAYLQKTDLDGNTLTYHRHKTGSPLTVTVPKEAMDIIDEWKNTDPDATYLFPILEENEKSQDNYRVYQQALRTFNYQLAKLANLLGFNSNISSYTARHTWATLAYYLEVHPGIISEAMGHSSIKVTETYLKPFNIKKLDETNKSIIKYAREAYTRLNY